MLTNSFRDLSTLSTGLLALLGSSGAAVSGPDAVKQLTQTKGTATALGVAHVAMTTSKHYQDWRGVVLWVAATIFSADTQLQPKDRVAWFLFLLELQLQL